eukprot:6604572-Prymnesium_polylepis.2
MGPLVGFHGTFFLTSTSDFEREAESAAYHLQIASVLSEGSEGEGGPSPSGMAKVFAYWLHH